MNSSYTAVISCVLVLGLSGCASLSTENRTVSEVTYSGNYNTLTGTLSDGTPFKGVAWFYPSSTRGQVCLQTADLVCSGKYAARVSRRISGQFVCSDMTTGTYVTERILDRNFVVPVKATGELSDGRTAVAEFAPIEHGSGTTTCFR